MSVRDTSITKKCEFCGKSYHPRKNGYQATSRFCDAICAKKNRRKGFVPGKLST